MRGAAEAKRRAAEYSLGLIFLARCSTSSSRKPSLIPRLGQVPPGHPNPTHYWGGGHPSLGTGLSPSLDCEARKGRALVVLGVPRPLGAKEVPGEGVF